MQGECLYKVNAFLPRFLQYFLQYDNKKNYVKTVQLAIKYYFNEFLTLYGAPRGVSKDAFTKGTAVLIENLKNSFVRRTSYGSILRDDAFGIPQDERLELKYPPF